ncbi:MAG: hypothetical protein VCD00_11900 [Candidatus Hydrogenedentota bacterium]
MSVTQLAAERNAQSKPERNAITREPLAPTHVKPENPPHHARNDGAIHAAPAIRAAYRPRDGPILPKISPGRICSFMAPTIPD